MSQNQGSDTSYKEMLKILDVLKDIIESEKNPDNLCFYLGSLEGLECMIKDRVKAK